MFAKTQRQKYASSASPSCIILHQHFYHPTACALKVRKIRSFDRRVWLHKESLQAISPLSFASSWEAKYSKVPTSGDVRCVELKQEMEKLVVRKCQGNNIKAHQYQHLSAGKCSHD